MIDFLNRFWGKVDVRGPDDCWPWKGARLKAGYGHLVVRQRSRTAHAVALEITSTDQLPAGMEACHRCDNPPCCNPAHLFPGTRSDNAKDCVSKGRNRYGRPLKRKLSALDASELRLIRSATQWNKRTAMYKREAASRGVSVRAIEKASRGLTWG